MNLVFTDPGLYPTEFNFSEPKIDWSWIFGLLKKYNTEYTYTSLTNNDGELIFTARRKLGETVWKLTYYSDKH